MAGGGGLLFLRPGYHRAVVPDSEPHILALPLGEPTIVGVPGAAGGLNEGGEQFAAQALSTRGGGDADISQLNLSGLEGVLVGGGENGLGQLPEHCGASQGQAQQFSEKPTEGLAELGVEGRRIRRAEGVSE